MLILRVPHRLQEAGLQAHTSVTALGRPRWVGPEASLGYMAKHKLTKSTMTKDHGCKGRKERTKQTVERASWDDETLPQWHSSKYSLREKEFSLAHSLKSILILRHGG